MKVKLIAYGIAKEILQTKEMEMEVGDSSSIKNLKNQLISNYPAFEKLRSLKFAVNQDYQEDSFLVKANDEVVIIPPVSGG